MLIQNQVGPIATSSSIAAGVQSPQRAGNLGDTIISELHGRYYEQTYRGNVYSLGVAAAAAITAYTGGAAGQPAVAIYNPVGSGKNLVLIQAGYNNVVAASAAGTVSWSIYYGQTVLPTQATVTVPWNNLTLNASGSVATGWTNQALTSSTALTKAYPLGYYYWATAAAAFASTATVADINGSIIVPPGSMAALGGTSALTSATWIAFLTWEEVPI